MNTKINLNIFRMKKHNKDIKKMLKLNKLFQGQQQKVKIDDKK